MSYPGTIDGSGKEEIHTTLDGALDVSHRASQLDISIAVVCEGIGLMLPY